jgi:hypothetical protein
MILVAWDDMAPVLESKTLWGETDASEKCNVTGELYFAARLLGPSKQKIWR